jgi:zinc transport system substrate-binding protein
LALSACSVRKTPQKPTIIVTIEPMRYFTEQLAGNRFQVITMVPRNSSPETYEPTPQQVAACADSKLYLSTGMLPFETNWMEKLKANAPQMSVCNTSTGISLLKTANGTETDPHVWMSPRNVRIMANNICQALIKADSPHSAEYQANLKKTLVMVDHVDSVIRRTMATAKGRTFVIYHPALTYFAHEYGLTQLSIENDGKEPTPVQLEAMIRTCKTQHVRCIFVQQQFTTHNAEIIAHECGARIVNINPLDYHWDSQITSIAKELSHE